jgi:hypothetical protein
MHEKCIHPLGHFAGKAAFDKEHTNHHLSLPGRKSLVLAGDEVPMVGLSGNTLLGYSDNVKYLSPI